MSNPRSRPETGPALPWWRVRMVWLVLSGPAIVVVAAIVTAVLAVHGADPVIAAEPEKSFADQPAVQGRNHAASPAPQR